MRRATWTILVILITAGVESLLVLAGQLSWQFVAESVIDVSVYMTLAALLMPDRST